MKKQLKKGDGLATVVISIALIAMVLLIIPAFKKLQANNTENISSIDSTEDSIISGILEKSNETGYSVYQGK